MGQYTEDSKELLRLVGGKENIAAVSHCMTRMRFVLVDPKKADIKAIEAMKENIILIAGGYDKNASYEEFIDAFPGRVKELILMGKTAPKIKAAAEAAGFTNITMASDMEACVAAAWEMAQPGDVVLLSPACASWDMYDNFEQRGDHFRECAQKL